MIDIDRQIAFLRQHPEFGRELAVALQRLADGTNNLARNLASDATKPIPAPPPIQAITVKSDGAGTFHATIDHNAEISRGIHYFAEWSTDASFSQPHVVHMGTSRTMVPQTLPAMDDNGNLISYHWRGYAAYPGGDPSSSVNFGGGTPTPLKPGGSAKMTPLSSTGSGTAPSDGQRGGSGFGRVITRPPQSPKRTSAQG